MEEPFTVQIDRMKGGQRSPIPLPIGTSGQPGFGWSKDEVVEIDQGWLVNHWSGGGMYVITVTDSATPPKKLEWRAFWSPAEYPEKIPPTLQGSANPNRIAQPQTQAPQVQPMSQFPGGLPSGGLMVAPQQAPNWQQPQPQPYYQPSPFYQPPTLFGQAANVENERIRRLEQQLEQQSAALAKAQADAAQRQYQVDLERERAANAEMIRRLETRIAELATASTQAKQASANDPELERLREQTRQLEARYEAERRERDAERREQGLREAIATMNANTQRQIEALQQQYQAQMLALQNNKQDPILQMMAEQNRNFIASLAQISQANATQFDRFQAYMMSPRDIFAIQKESSQGVDAITSKLGNAYTSVMDMQQKVIENAMQLNQGGSPAVDLIREGIGNAKEMFERYIGSRGKTEQVAKQAEAQAMTAQAQAAAISAQAQVEIARIQNMPQPIQPPAQIVQKPAAPSNSNGLNGAQAATNASFEEWKRSREAQAAADIRSAMPQPTPSGQPTATYPDNRKILGRTDTEWFGDFADEVRQLRMGVAIFIEGLKRGDASQGATPQLVTDGICQAQAAATAGGIPVPAIIELLNQSKYNEFLQVLLPDAPEEMQKDIVKMLRQRLDGELDDDGDDDDDEDDGIDDGDDDGEQSDDVKDGHVAKPAPKVVVVKPGKQSARA